MLPIGLLTTSIISSSTDILSTSPPQHNQAHSHTLARQLRSASSAFIAGAGAVSTTDCHMLDSFDQHLSTSPQIGSSPTRTTTMSCSPPITYPRTASFTRTLIVPSAALASSKTRSKKRRGGGGGEDDDGFDGGDGWSGGGDGGDGNNGPGDNEDAFNGDHSRGGTWIQDILLLWSVFSAWSTYQAIQYCCRQKQVVSTPVFAAVSFAAAGRTSSSSP